MATAALCGSGGSVTGPAGVTEIVSWTITQTVDVQDATSMSSSGWKERIACLTGATGNFKTIGAKAAVGATTIDCKTATAGTSISGSIIITKITIENPVGDVVSFSHDFNFTGTVTIA